MILLGCVDVQVATQAKPSRHFPPFLSPLSISGTMGKKRRYRPRAIDDVDDVSVRSEARASAASQHWLNTPHMYLQRG
jgi:hypothetical protein